MPRAAPSLQTAWPRETDTKSQITKGLCESVFDTVFPELVKALAEGDPNKDVGNPAWRNSVKEAALILLFRFLFILYAEDRGLLPVDNDQYLDYSFRRLRDDAAAVAEDRLAVQESPLDMVGSDRGPLRCDLEREHGSSPARIQRRIVRRYAASKL